MKKTFAALHWQEGRKYPNNRESPQRWQLCLLNELLDRKYLINNNESDVNDTTEANKKLKRDDKGRFC